MTALGVHDLVVTLAGRIILTGVSFEIDPGQTVALLGDNGSGKSTLVKAILGLVGHQHGSISLLGTDLAHFSAWDQIGYVPQRATVSLHSTTVWEVVASGLLARRPVGWTTRRGRAKVVAALDKVGLADQARELYLHLSGGQQQRVLIARAIVNQPRLLLMDEPFAGVDLVHQAEIAQALTDPGVTRLVVLHELGAWAGQLHRALTLRDGHLVSDDVRPTDAPGSHEHSPPDRTHLLTGMEPRWIS